MAAVVDDVVAKTKGSEKDCGEEKEEDDEKKEIK